MPTRRERLRAETTDDIKAAALEQVRREGAAQLSLRAVARDLGMSAPGLYRYFDDRDALLTALIADAHGDLADAVERAGRDRDDDDVAGRLLDRALAFRRWAVGHPGEFGLIYGDPVRGYAAPPDGPTVAPVARFGAAFIELFLAAWHRGELRTGSATPVDGGVAAALFRDLDPTDLGAPDGELPPPEVVGILIGAWGRMHGLVSLEVFGHLDFLGVDLGRLYEAEIVTMLGELGLVVPAAT